MKTARRTVILVLLFSGFFSAAQDAPPKEGRAFREAELVEVVKLDPTIRLDVRYATANNFAGRAFYAEARAFL
jgi:D-alanyl-D-alanine dipeptidase